MSIALDPQSLRPSCDQQPVLGIKLIKESFDALMRLLVIVLGNGELISLARNLVFEVVWLGKTVIGSRYHGQHRGQRNATPVVPLENRRKV